MMSTEEAPREGRFSRVLLADVGGVLAGLGLVFGFPLTFVAIFATTWFAGECAAPLFPALPPEPAPLWGLGHPTSPRYSDATLMIMGVVACLASYGWFRLYEAGWRAFFRRKGKMRQETPEEQRQRAERIGEAQARATHAAEALKHLSATPQGRGAQPPKPPLASE